jgi:LmbE family N-acetylglucosaminyl deacetylase
MAHPVGRRAWELAADPAFGLSAGVSGEPWRARLYAMAPVTEGWEEIAALMKQEGLDASPIEEMLERRREEGTGLRPEDATAAIDVSEYAEVQREALLRHRTQVPDDSFFMTLPPVVRRRAFATAYLVRLWPEPAPGERDLDLLPK